MGPSAVRAAGLNAALKTLGYEVEDAGNIHVKLPEELHFGDIHAKYLKEITDTCRDAAHLVYRTLEEGYFPISLGGDHSIAAGTEAGVSKFYRDRGQALGLIWVDAHADMNTPETSPSGNVHGMPFAATLGLGPEPLAMLFGYKPKFQPQNAVLIGARNLDERERRLVKGSGIHVFTMRAIDELGMGEITERSLKLACEGTAGFVVSFDMDVARGRNAGSRRHHLPRRAPPHGNGLRLRKNGCSGTGRD